MRAESRECGRRSRLPILALTVLWLTSAACSMAGFGGALQLNITDGQTRQLTIAIDGGSADARVFEIEAAGEVELGTGSATIERYLLHRATFGSGVALGYFLCPKPCSDPLSSYLVAYSPDQIFNATGTLELHLRVVSASGSSQELTRTISPEMLPSLWENPRIAAGPAQR